MRVYIFILILMMAAGSLFALNETETKRFEALTKEIRCVVCQNQNIADSNAPLANDLRDKVYQMMVEHKSDNEIKEYLVKRYGEFILLRPRLSKTTVILWVFPVLLLAGVLCFVILSVAKNRASKK